MSNCISLHLRHFQRFKKHKPKPQKAVMSTNNFWDNSKERFMLHAHFNTNCTGQRSSDWLRQTTWRPMYVIHFFRLQVRKAFIQRVVCPRSSIIYGLMPPRVQGRQLLLGTRSALSLSVKPCTSGAAAATPLTSATCLPIHFSGSFSDFPLQRLDSEGNSFETT